MPWLKLDDEFPDHKKVAGLSNDAFCLHVTAMCWVAKWQTDGKLPSKLLGKLAWRCQDPASAANELVAANVWEITPEGWEIHDFLEYNPTKEQIAELAVTRSEAGKAGAKARWQNHSKTHGTSQENQWQTDGKKMPHSPFPIKESNNIESSKYENRVSDSDASVMTTPTYPPGFEEFEKVFQMNLITEVKERDPRQSMMGGFSFDETSRALLLQVFNKGPMLSSKAVTWGMDQWESAKKDQQFRVQDRGCINWLLTTIFNSYKPTGKASAKNGSDPAKPKTVLTRDFVTDEIKEVPA